MVIIFHAKIGNISEFGFVKKKKKIATEEKLVAILLNNWKSPFIKSKPNQFVFAIQ